MSCMCLVVVFLWSFRNLSHFFLTEFRNGGEPLEDPSPAPINLPLQYAAEVDCYGTFWDVSIVNVDKWWNPTGWTELHMNLPSIFSDINLRTVNTSWRNDNMSVKRLSGPIHYEHLLVIRMKLNTLKIMHVQRTSPQLAELPKVDRTLHG